MPYLSKRTVRGLLARSRPSSSPAPQPTAETTPAPQVSVQEGTPESPPPVSTALPLSISAPAGLAQSPASRQSSAGAITANEERINTPASAHSQPASPTDAATDTQNTPNSVQSEGPVGTTHHIFSQYIEAGIPPAIDTGAAFPSQPVFSTSNEQNQQAPASSSAPFRFNGIFAVPSLPAAVPPTPGAPPPLYQPRASQPEVFPELAFTPFHCNAIASRTGGSLEYEIPGDDRFPRPEQSRTLNGSWLGGRFERFTVGGRIFFCPVDLMLRYPHWRLLLNLERPPQGWVLSSSVDATIFALVMEALVSPSGFDGTEPGLNLVKIALAACQAFDWGMDREVAKLIASFRRYTARRIFYRDPYRPDTQGAMDHNYFVYRSEEIVRAWRVLQSAPGELQDELHPVGLGTLYTLAVPRDLWPALTAEFPEEFTAHIDMMTSLIPEAVNYPDWWLRYHKNAGLLNFEWMSGMPQPLASLFEERPMERPLEQMPQARDPAGNRVDGLPTEGDQR